MFETVSEGFVFEAPVTSGPRLWVRESGEIVCMFMVQSALGINDFVPLVARSQDQGLTWSAPQPAFPASLTQHFSIFCSVGAHGFAHGIRIPIDQPGESFWSDAAQGMKQNQMFCSLAAGDGQNWSDPLVIPMDGPGSAESPCPLLVTRDGRWISTYSPYRTFDPAEMVDRERVVIALSDDKGKTWRHRDALRFAEKDSGGAEAWTIELSDGRLLCACWHVDHTSARDFPNAYAISEDGGDSWSPTASTGILGQSIALVALAGGRVLMVYNQRKHGDPGVWIAQAKPTAESFGIEENERAWSAQTTTQHGTSAGHSEWTDFSFGEPSVAELADGTFLLVLWCIQPGGSGIRYVKLRKRA